MKTKLALVAMVFVFLWITPAFAQWRTLATAEVPYEFTVDTTVFPPGHYAVQTYLHSPSTLMILNVDTHQSAMVLHNHILITGGQKQPGKTKLVFTSDEGRHVLHQVVIEGDDHIHDIMHGTEVAELIVSPR